MGLSGPDATAGNRRVHGLSGAQQRRKRHRDGFRGSQPDERDGHAHDQRRGGHGLDRGWSRVANITFSGAAGERVYAEATTWHYSGLVNVVAYAPDGTVWDSGSWTGVDAGVGGSDSGLPQTGQYRLFLGPTGNAAGSMVVTFYIAAADASYQVTPSQSGAAVTVSTTPGQNAQITFSQTAGQRFYVWANGSSWTYPGQLAWTITSPTGTVMSSGGPWTKGNLWFDMGETTDPSTGTYTLVLNTKSAGAGSATFNIYQVPADSSWSSGIGYTPAPISITTPGQNAWVEFSGTSGQVVKVNSASDTIADSNVWLLNPDDTWVSLGSWGTAGGTFSTTLTQTGTFWVYIDPQLNDTGSMSVTLTDPPAKAGAAAAPGTANAAASFRGRTLTLSPSAALVAQLQRFAAERAAVGGVHVRRGRRAAVPRSAASFKTRQSAFWSPGKSDRTGGWDMRADASPWSRLVPLAAPRHGTELAGQVLKLNGLPVAGVRLAISGTRAAATTDATGRYLLTNIPRAGNQVLTVDGSAAGSRRRHFARFEIAVDLKRNRETVLAYDIWLPELDPAHAVRVNSPLRKALVLRTPHIPGLEVKIPAGSTITDANGKPITSLTVIPVPVDRPPFPLPLGSKFPIYLSVQPADAYVSRGAQIIYPNYAHLPRGQRVPFWNYDPASRGWYIYGSGVVSRNGKKIVPTAGTRLWQFTGAMVSSTETPPSLSNTFDSTSSSSLDEASSSGADPVNLGSGLFTYQKTDLEPPDVLPISDTRVYRPADPNSYSFGVGMASLYDMRLYSTNNYFTAELILPNGTDIHYQCVENCATSWNANEVYEAQNTPSEFDGSQISVDREVGGNGVGWFNLRLRDGLTYVFSEELGFGLEAIRDRFGNQITIERNTAGLATQVNSPNGRWIEFTYDSSNRITQATDNTGRVVKYTYNSAGQLAQVTAANGSITKYTYSSSTGWMTHITDARGNPLVVNTYDANGRVTQQTIGTESTPYTFSYTLNSSGQVTQSTMTSPNGNKTVTNLSGGYPTSQTFASGTSLAETTSYVRQAGTNLITSETDPLGRTTAFTYDGKGNVTSITQMSGTSSARKTSVTYDPVFSQPTAVTDPLGNTTTYGYDSLGELTSITTPLGSVTKIAYANQNGQPTSITDPLGKVTSEGYTLGDLTSLTDPDGNVSRTFLDPGGRLVQSVDQLGNTTTYAYDALNEQTSVTDPAGDATQYTYDPDGDVATIKDARGNTTTFTYDAEDRLSTRKDALGHVRTYGYDNDGNLTSVTDPKGQKDTYQLDALDRLSFAGFTAAGGTSYQSTINYTYDLGNRLTKVVDSTGGTFTETPDNFDELTEESGPKGSISYTYDADGRRLTSTVAGHTAVSFGYDKNSDLTLITQGSQNVGLAYDTDGRVTKTTLPDGITENYAYDPASRVTGLTYDTSAGAVLGDRHYAYGPSGQETSVSGSYARLTIPQAWGTATYNADNALSALGSTTYTYDANGNLTSNGPSSYTWNVRDQLTGLITGSTTDSFTYDPFGRREQATISGTTTGYLYDGLNVAQDLSGTTPQTNYLLGLGLDQRYSRTDSSGTQSYLTDLNESTVALASSTGTIPTSYTYDPFGQATTSGTASTNPYQYAGAANDGTGLQYDLARYYAPATASFISQDPAGFAGSGINLYAYAFDQPTNLSDSTGAGPTQNDVLNLALGAAGSLAGPKDGGGADGGAPNAGSGGAGGGEPPDVQAPPAGEEPPEDLPTVEIDANRMPTIARNIQSALDEGHPSVLNRTTDQDLISSNRAAATRGFEGAGSPDEYPFASTYQGGAGARVEEVPLGEQRIQGGVLSRFYAQNGIGEGDPFAVRVTGLEP